MFEDSIVTLMVMLLLCFLGMLVMFLFVIRSNTQLTSAIKDLSRQMQLGMGDTERRLMDIAFSLREAGGEKKPQTKNDDISSLLNSIGEAEETLNRSIRSNVRRKASDGDSGLPDLSLAADFSQPLK